MSRRNFSPSWQWCRLGLSSAVRKHKDFKKNLCALTIHTPSPGKKKKNVRVCMKMIECHSFNFWNVSWISPCWNWGTWLSVMLLNWRIGCMFCMFSEFQTHTRFCSRCTPLLTHSETLSEHCRADPEHQTVPKEKEKGDYCWNETECFYCERSFGCFWSLHVMLLSYFWAEEYDTPKEGEGLVCFSLYFIKPSNYSK